MTAVAVATGRLSVPQATWREAPSRAAFRAEPSPIEVAGAALEQAASGGFVVAGPDGVVGGTRVVTVGPLVLTLEGDDVAVRVTPPRWVRPSRRPTEAGLVGPGRCLEVAWNSRGPAKTLSGTGPMVYVDEVWRVWRPAELQAGTLLPPSPDRTVDLRVILH